MMSSPEYHLIGLRHLTNGWLVTAVTLVFVPSVYWAGCSSPSGTAEAEERGPRDSGTQSHAGAGGTDGGKILLPDASKAGAGGSSGHGGSAGHGGAGGSDGQAGSGGVVPCAKRTCEELDAECGSITDGCGGIVDCGTCLGTSICNGGKCGAAPCTPQSCDQIGVECGSVSNGCGGIIDCGTCPGGGTCVNGKCGCTSSQRLCNGTCIGNDACCTDSDCSGLSVCATPGSPCSCRTSPGRAPIYRMHLASNHDHMLTVVPNEGAQYNYTSEGIAFYDYTGPCSWGLVPFYRLSNSSTGEHFYTASASERDSAVSAYGFKTEGDIGCIALAAECGAVPLYRVLNQSSGGKHLFTANVDERNGLISGGWKDEGIAGYVWGNQ